MIQQGRNITEHLQLQCDVCIVGSGAGGGTAAMILAQAGYSVIVLEAGGHVTRKRFTMEEGEVYPLLYQEGMRRTTDDQAILLMQGRAFGGGTVSNWTTAYRTPHHIREYWKEFHGLIDFAGKALNPHWDAMEARLAVRESTLDEINPNNQMLANGCEQLGFSWKLVRRAVRGCKNTGYCGMGCPIDAKQSMAITGLPDAIGAGASVFTDCRVWRLVANGNQVKRVEGYFHHPEQGDGPTGGRISVDAEICILSGGALNTPALLLRSEIGNQSGMVGKRTFVQPKVMVTGWHDAPIEPYFGVPQSVDCLQFFDENIDRLNYYIQAAPLHPTLYATLLPSMGTFHREAMQRIKHTSTVVATLIDGLHEDEDGGTVSLRPDGSPSLSYDYTSLLWDSVRRAVSTIARIALASGAHTVYSSHEEPVRLTGEAAIPTLEAADYGPNRLRLFSTAQVGGCAMGRNPGASVVNADLRHHHMKNLYVMDGSVCPTAVGVDPQLTIYGLVHRAATRLAAKGRTADNR
ncbi:MAG: GMC family oxidoreductase N-terminal domain-containing protein [Bradymonadia bacterium]